MVEVFAHEFFHCWNVERMRPKTLEPFNFEKSNMSNELWFAEGFTQYYGELLTERGGFTELKDYLGSLGFYINTKNVSPGGRLHSPIENSQMAVFVDAGVAIDQTNYPTRYSSYYPLGAAVALALDLELRTKFNHTLDDFMQAAWKQFGKTEIPYTVPGLEGVLEKLTTKSFATDFFQKFIYGHETYNYANTLTAAGFGLKGADEGKAWWGNVRFIEGKTQLRSNTIPGSPIYEAGLDIGDELLSIDGKLVKNPTDITGILQQHKPGDQIEVRYKHRDEEKNVNLRLTENPSFTVYDLQDTGKALTPEQLSFRRSWFGSKVALGF
jgi:predicted metalloprotease with PDZ domain